MHYNATTRRQDSDCDAVVIHCSDHRFQQGFREFLSQGLGLGSYALLAIPGGGHFGSMADMLPKLAKVGMQSLKFLVTRSGANRIILIAHDDCLYFKEVLQFFFTEPDLNKKQTANLTRARRVLMERYPRVSVELYFAAADSTGSLQFLSVE